MEAVDGFDAGDGRGAGAEDAHAFNGGFLEPLAEISGPGGGFGEL